jgi:hypothetical protein
MAHTVISHLFAAGLRIQQLAPGVPESLQLELHEVADQLDRAIRELRSYAFDHGHADSGG